MLFRTLCCMGSSGGLANGKTRGTAKQSQDGLQPPRPSQPSPSAAAERYGMFPIVDQPHDAEGVVDIVAVHGLGGHFAGTWTTHTASTPPCNWLKDLLPTHVPNARIMSFGYNSAVALSKSIGDISTFGEQLLNKVLQKRPESQRNRPIIFVCHSLGGIVLKRVFNSHKCHAYSTCGLTGAPWCRHCGTPTIDGKAVKSAQLCLTASRAFYFSERRTGGRKLPN